MRPVQPGYKTWLIEPQPGDLSWAKGRSANALRADCQSSGTIASNRFSLMSTSRPGHAGLHRIPAPVGRASIKVNGRLFKQKKSDKQVDGRDGYAYVNDLPPGNYSIVAHRQVIVMETVLLPCAHGFPGTGKRSRVLSPRTALPSYHALRDVFHPNGRSF